MTMPGAKACGHGLVGLLFLFTKLLMNLSKIYGKMKYQYYKRDFERKDSLMENSQELYNIREQLRIIVVEKIDKGIATM